LFNESFFTCPAIKGGDREKKRRPSFWVEYMSPLLFLISFLKCRMMMMMMIVIMVIKPLI